MLYMQHHTSKFCCILLGTAEYENAPSYCGEWERKHWQAFKYDYSKVKKTEVVSTVDSYHRCLHEQLFDNSRSLHEELFDNIARILWDISWKFASRYRDCDITLPSRLGCPDGEFPSIYLVLDLLLYLGVKTILRGQYVLFEQQKLKSMIELIIWC